MYEYVFSRSTHFHRIRFERIAKHANDGMIKKRVYFVEKKQLVKSPRNFSFRVSVPNKKMVQSHVTNRNDRRFFCHYIISTVEQALKTSV